MRYLKKFNESNTITKSELVDTIKYYSNYVERYMEDVNKYTTSNLNMSFSYGTILNISQIFDATGELKHNSQDGFITALCSEFIIWGEYFTENKWHGKKQKEKFNLFKFDHLYSTYDDEYKTINKHSLYDQKYKHMIYVYVGEKIKQLISGTKWDIPKSKKEFTKDDRDFIIDCLISDFNDSKDYIELCKKSIDLSGFSQNRLKIIIPKVDSNTYISYDSDFIYRMQSYFNGVLIDDINRYSEHLRSLTISIYLPFYIRKKND